MLWAAAARQLFSGLKLLTADTVEAPILLFINVFFFASNPKLFGAFDMPLLGCSYKTVPAVVPRKIQGIFKTSEYLGVFFHKLRYWHTRLLSGQNILQRVFVRAHEQANVLFAVPRAVIPRDNIGVYFLQRVADMRLGLHVIYGGCYIEFL